NEWRYRFEADAGNYACSRAGSTPAVLQDQLGMTMRVPLYNVQLDGTDQQVKAADVRLAGPNFAPLMCWSVFGIVPNKFIQTVNLTINNNTFSEIFRLSLRELAEKVQRLKIKADALPRS